VITPLNEKSFGGYFPTASPAGWIMEKLGYKKCRVISAATNKEPTELSTGHLSPYEAPGAREDFRPAREFYATPYQSMSATSRMAY
jgi:hypothetical protein